MQSQTALQNNGLAGNSEEQDLLVDEASIQSRFISRPNSPLRLFWNAAQSSIPSFEAASLLVDTYFDRAHWFMLLFHQDDFRRRWPTLYDDFDPRSRSNTSDIGLMSTFIMVIAIGLHYAGDHRCQVLQSYGVVPNKLKDGLVDIVQHHLLTILSLQSLEAVQTCVLLGTHFLFHGSPALAWPICGCGLRVAQALNLHRQEARSRVSNTSPEHLKHIEANKRCWWAIYEIETFCSMSYGYPHGIKDDDCDVQPLDPSAKLPSPQSPASFNEPLRCKTTLLSYKYFMSKLSVILKEILTQLYGTGPHTFNTGGLDSFPIQPQRLIDKASELDSKLKQWSSEVPKELHLKVEAFNPPAYESINDLDRDIGASGPRFETHIFQLQSLNLWLAYENAIILIHRPLLYYRLIPRELSNDSYGSDPFRSSFRACRDAALRTSQIASMSILDLASNTYAATFIGIHTFASGLTLGILSSMELFTPSSLQMKLGLQNLLFVQMKLKERSDLCAQGLDLLKRLIKHIMDKELSAMLDPSKAITPRLILDEDRPRDLATADIQPTTTFGHTEIDPNNSNSADASKASYAEPSYEFADDPESLGPSLGLDCMPDSCFLEALSDFDKGMIQVAGTRKKQQHLADFLNSLVFTRRVYEFAGSGPR